MTNAIILQAIQLLAGLVLGSGTLDRIAAVVERWADQELTGAEKRAGVLAELEVIGLKLTESLTNLGIELAVTYLKKQTEVK